MTVAVVIPFRDRGTDPLRAANLKRILDDWHTFAGMPTPFVTHDGRIDGDAQFNRSAAYNRGVQHFPDADVFVFAESDMLIHPAQIHAAINLAKQAPGLVVPYTQFRYLSEPDSQRVRDGADPAEMTPESVIPNEQRSWPRTGPLNVVSRETINLVGGWDEQFEGSWWDDRAMNIAFDMVAALTRFVAGPAYHLYHLPGWTGDHLTAEDRAATARNRRRFLLYRQAETPERIRELTAGGV